MQIHPQQIFFCCLPSLGFFQFNFWVYSKQAYNQRIFDLVIFSRDSTTNYDFPILSNSILDNDRIPFVQNNTNFNQLYHINWKSKRNIQPTRVMLINLFISKVHIFWEGHKILRNLPLTFDPMYCSQKLGEDFAKFLWPSQNIWTLPAK